MARAPVNTDGASEKPDTDIRSIAATLLKQPAKQEAPQPDLEEDLDPDAGEELDEVDTSDADEQDEDESPTSGTDDEDGEEDDTSSDADDEGGEEDTGEDDEQDEGDEADYLDVRDDDIITVMVDDEEQEVSIGDLKRNFSLGKATEQRLQEATEVRKEAHAARTKALEDFAANTAIMDGVFDSLDDSFFKGVIPAPPEELRKTNPEAYLRHKDAYDTEQNHISEARKALEKARKDAKAKREEALKEYSEQAAKVVAQYIPELTDPKTANQTFAGMSQMAMAYGYTAQEINSALDPRMFLIMRDLVKYHTLVNKTRGRDVQKNDGQKAKRVRRLRSGNTNARNRARAADKSRKTAVETARRTGKAKDIAATLLVPAPPKG